MGGLPLPICLVTLFGQQPQKGQCPVEHGGTFVCMSVHACHTPQRFKSQPQGLNPTLEAHIPPPRLKFQPQGSNPSLVAQILVSQTQLFKSPPVFYRTSSPSGPLPCYPSPTITNIQSRAKGIADHILPLGDWLLLLLSVCILQAFLGLFRSLIQLI